MQRRDDEELQSGQHNRFEAPEKTCEASGLEVVRIVFFFFLVDFFFWIL